MRKLWNGVKKVGRWLRDKLFGKHVCPKCGGSSNQSEKEKEWSEDVRTRKEKEDDYAEAIIKKLLRKETEGVSGANGSSDKKNIQKIAIRPKISSDGVGKGVSLELDEWDGTDSGFEFIYDKKLGVNVIKEKRK